MSRNTIVALVVVAALAAWWFYSNRTAEAVGPAGGAAGDAGGVNPAPGSRASGISNTGSKVFDVIKFPSKVTAVFSKVLPW